MSATTLLHVREKRGRERARNVIYNSSRSPEESNLISSDYASFSFHITLHKSGNNELHGALQNAQDNFILFKSLEEGRLFFKFYSFSSSKIYYDTLFHCIPCLKI